VVRDASFLPFLNPVFGGRAVAFHPSSHRALVSVTDARVLIVDDDDSVRDLFTRAFVREGFTVNALASGQEAFELMKHEAPELIVLDLMLPFMNGIEVLTAMRQRPNLAMVPVLVVTATATSAYDLREFGPLRVIRKPCELFRLVATARDMIADPRAES
jgi:DNA-binding response OmpR family regulator